MAELARIDEALAVLADPQRRKVVDLLSQGPLAAGDLSRALGGGAPAMSRHLKLMKAAGFVEESHPTYDARVRIYALRTNALGPIKAWLSQTEMMWSEQLSGFKAHIEQ